MNKIRIGISSCLLGNEVRFDGGHKHDHYITDTLGCFFDLVPVCPEKECGLPVPREPMSLFGTQEYPRLLANKTGIDLTEKMNTWAQNRVRELEKEDLCGFIFKSKSPSCGMERVKVYDKNNTPKKVGVGLFARSFQEAFPFIPAEEESRLHNMTLRENFIESIFVYCRWRTVTKNFSLANLLTFHTEHKTLLRAHSEKHYCELGRIAAKAGNLDLRELLAAYQKNLTAAIKVKTTVSKHVNVLMHIMGHFKKFISNDEKQELLELIEQFRQQHVPLIVPITMLNHYVRKYQESYLQKQFYLKPDPTELKLKYHA